MLAYCGYLIVTYGLHLGATYCYHLKSMFEMLLGAVEVTSMVYLITTNLDFAFNLTEFN